MKDVQCTAKRNGARRASNNVVALLADSGVCILFRSCKPDDPFDAVIIVHIVTTNREQNVTIVSGRVDGETRVVKLDETSNRK